MELAIRAGRLITPDEELNDILVLTEHGKIQSVEPFSERRAAQAETFVDARDEIVAPGFVDLQVNGGLGHNFKRADLAERHRIYRFFLRTGTTTLVPTVVTDVPTLMAGALSMLADDVGGTQSDLPEIAGVHLEGPFLNPDRRGAHPLEYLRSADLDLARYFWEAAREQIAIVTLAPELEGADRLVRWFAERGVVVAAGHTTASCDVLFHACDEGLTLLTHLGNVSDWPHRRKSEAGILASEPGAVGAFMISDRLRASLILDSYHFDPRLAAALVRLRGPQGVALISDASYATGCLPGKYDDGLIKTTVHPDGYAYVTGGGGWLAGSVITLEQAIRVAVGAGGIALREAIEMATWTPARILGIDNRKGRVAAGFEADLVFLNRLLRVTRVFRSGREVPL